MYCVSGLYCRRQGQGLTNIIPSKSNPNYTAVSGENSNPQTMHNRNVKLERIRIKFRARSPTKSAK